MKEVIPEQVQMELLKNKTLEISKYLYQKFDELGIPNELTRTTDETLPQKAQSFYGNGSDVILLSNHINAGGGDSHCVTKV